MVLATRAPTVTAPKNSKIAAPIIACRKLTDLDEMEVAHEFATSSEQEPLINTQLECGSFEVDTY